MLPLIIFKKNHNCYKPFNCNVLSWKVDRSFVRWGDLVPWPSLQFPFHKLLVNNQSELLMGFLSIPLLVPLYFLWGSSWGILSPLFRQRIAPWDRLGLSASSFCACWWRRMGQNLKVGSPNGKAEPVSPPSLSLGMTLNAVQLGRKHG